MRSNTDTLSLNYQQGNYKTARHQHRLKLRVILVLVCIFIILLASSLYTVFVVLVRVVFAEKVPNYQQDCAFVLINLGNNGGLTEENLTSFLLARNGTAPFVTLDAGVLLYGLRQILNVPMFEFPAWASNEYQKAGYILKEQVAGYFIGHAHLDHVAGMVHASPEDFATNIPSKGIIGLNSTLRTIQTSIYNDQVWPNIPQLVQRHHYATLEDGKTYRMQDLLRNVTSFDDVQVTPFATCHGAINSTTFLFSTADSQILFFSDTGISDDCPSWKDRILRIWSSPLLDMKRLKTIIIECSFPNATATNRLFGHLRPSDLLELLQDLKKTKQVADMSQVQVLVFHTKPSLGNAAEDSRAMIERELQQDASFKITLVKQGQVTCVPK